jgi:hypothetical protein
MADKKPDPQAHSSWDKDSQNLKLDFDSKPARKRFFVNLFLPLAAIVLFVILAFGVIWVIQENRRLGSFVIFETTEGLPELVISGNSGLPEETIREMVFDFISTDLKKVNPYAVKCMLERHGQIRSAEVSKNFPDQLLIRITERQPILMLATQEKDEETEFWGVDQYGIIFKPHDLERIKILKLPFLKGIKIDKIEDGRTYIGGTEKVHYLLQLIKRDAYPVYTDIRSVSLENYDEGVPELGAVIILKGRQMKRIIFGVENFEYQVGKLISVLSMSGSVHLEKKEIDLSYSGDAIIR